VPIDDPLFSRALYLAGRPWLSLARAEAAKCIHAPRLRAAQSEVKNLIIDTVKHCKMDDQILKPSWHFPANDDSECKLRAFRAPQNECHRPYPN